MSSMTRESTSLRAAGAAESEEPDPADAAEGEAPRPKKKKKRPKQAAPPPPAPSSGFDERALAKGLAIGLPLVTGTLAATAGVLLGPAIAILVMIAGVMLGVIALLWASLRVLSGDAPLPPELQALEEGTHGVDLLATRKKMLLRALKDLENERAVGKLEAADFEQVSSTYRAELKHVLRLIDEELAPHRARAEDMARRHLVDRGLADVGYRGEQPPNEPASTEVPEAEATSADDRSPSTKDADRAGRESCKKCGASNEVDAKFCKGCGATMDKEEDAVDA